MMTKERAFPLSVVVLVTAVMMMLLFVMIFLNLKSAMLAGAIAAGGSVLLVAVGTGFLYWATRRLEVSEARLSTIVESASEGIISTDANGYVESVNTSAVAMFSYRPGEIIGSRITILFSSSYRDAEEGVHLAGFLKKNGMNASGKSFEVTGLRRDGFIFPMDFSISSALLGERHVFVAMVRDVSARVAAREALKQARDELEARVEQRTVDLQQANQKLEAEIVERKRTEREREKLIQELQEALSQVKTLSGLLPICASCKKVRDDGGYWNQIEVYLQKHSEAQFSHGLCPQCAVELYPELQEEESPS